MMYNINMMYNIKFLYTVLQCLKHEKVYQAIDLIFEEKIY